jgi:hypothetical protein
MLLALVALFGLLAIVYHIQWLDDITNFALYWYSSIFGCIALISLLAFVGEYVWQFLFL